MDVLFLNFAPLVLRLPAQLSAFSPDVKFCFITNTGKVWRYANFGVLTFLSSLFFFFFKVLSDFNFFSSRLFNYRPDAPRTVCSGK